MHACARSVLRTSADLAVAIVLQRCADEKNEIADPCSAMCAALDGRSWDDVHPILQILGNWTRQAFHLKSDALADSIAHPKRRAAMRQALASVAALPPESALPAMYALKRWQARRSKEVHGEAAEGLALALRNDGAYFLTIAESLEDAHLRAALTPLPNDPTLAKALRALMQDDPDVGRKLAHAIQQCMWNDAVAALLEASPLRASTILTSLPDDDRSALLSSAEARALSLAADGCMDDLQTAWRCMANTTPQSAFALAMLASDDPSERTFGIATLAKTPNLVRSFLRLIRSDIQNVLCDHPAIAAAVSDLSDAADARKAQPRIRHHNKI